MVTQRAVCTRLWESLSCKGLWLSMGSQEGYPYSVITPLSISAPWLQDHMCSLSALGKLLCTPEPGSAPGRWI